MRRFIPVLAFAIVLGTASRPSSATEGDGHAGPPPDLASRVMAIVDAVQEHHIDPPPRAELIAAGLVSLLDGGMVQGDDHSARRALGRRGTDPARSELLRRVEEVETTEELARLLEDTWTESGRGGEWPDPSFLGGVPGTDPGDPFLQGVFARVPGHLRSMTDSERTVEEQFAGNRYVGLQIAISYDEEAGLVQVGEVLPGGPAERAGLLEGDRIESIDGDPMQGLPFPDVLARLRGEEGTSVTLVIRRPSSNEPRTFEVRREVLPRPTIADGKPGAVPPGPVALVAIKNLAGSTLHELRTLEGRLRSEGKRALILDLRGTDAPDPHHAVLVADGLLDEGPIGTIRTIDGVQSYRSGPDCLFRRWPMAVLVDVSTAGPAEWLAAALKDRGRAILVGLPTAGEAFEQSAVPVRGGGWLLMRTGELGRIDGRPMREASPDAFAVRHRAVAAPPGPETHKAFRPRQSGRGILPDLVALPQIGRQPGDPAIRSAAERLMAELGDAR